MTCVTERISFGLRRVLFIIAAGMILIPVFGIGAQTPEEEKRALEDELKKLEAQITQYEQDVTKTKKEKQTLQSRIQALKGEIQKLDLQISQGNLMIRDLGVQIKDTEKSVSTTEQQIGRYRERLAVIMRRLQGENQKSLIEILLGENELSDFFSNFVALERLNVQNQKLLASIKDLRCYLEEQKVSLADEKEDLEKVVSVQLLQKQRNVAAQKEQQTVLKQTEGKEQTYQQLLATSRQKAAEIRARIFELIGVPNAPTFGEAAELAKYVETVTNIRAAFLLAVLTQESNIGKNVGQCYLKNPDTGAGTIAYNGKTVSKVMHPSRDAPHFLRITKELGRDPFGTAVSCPIPTVGGYGGAMGPGQFIPSTWVLIESKLKAVTGGNVDPWSIKDSFMATGIFLRDLGGVTNEWSAAMKYFSGSSWSKYEEFYGNSVMALANRYQQDIEIISQ